MSRLPRLRSSSPDRGTDAGPFLSGPTRTLMSTSLKRKAPIAEEGEEDLLEAQDQPRKLPAIAAGKSMKPLQPSRTATNLTGSGGATRAAGGASLKPPSKPSSSTLARSTRGTSAPPVSSSSSTKPPSRTGAARPPTGRVVSGGPRSASATAATKRLADEKRLDEIQSQLSSLEAARLADASKLATDMEAERSKVAQLQANHLAISRQLATAKSQEITQRRELVYASDEIEKLKKKHAEDKLDLEMDLKRRERELRDVNEDLRLCRSDLERERGAIEILKATVNQQSTSHLTLTSQNQVLESQNRALQQQIDGYARQVSALTLKLESTQHEVDDLKKEAMESELVRRKLHNMVQELKGNIRVFCRVRPILPSDVQHYAATLGGGGSSHGSSSSGGDNIDFDRAREELQGNIAFPDRREHREIVVCSASSNAMGVERTDSYSFNFDRVFEPESTQAEVFEEISQLAQSCIDGYNVCIFAYGQTGSGKSFTMEGGSTDSSSGMIPRAVEQVFRMAEHMKTKGWEYKIEGQFLEIYNETINDLLGKHDFDKKKHEIKHDPKTGATRVTDVEVVPLTSSAQVRTLLARAQKRRSVAATLMNERSSRSHSVFTLRISGVNVGLEPSPSSAAGGSDSEGVKGTGERCEGSLNLVDLAGSERLNVSFGNGAEKERVRETQNINKSLSALGDVIAALGEAGRSGGVEAAGKHIPYRNSKLTYLLQNSLSGNSKTLMFLNLSPLAAHFQESLTSLRFAHKVNTTQIGTAKKQTR